MDFGHPAEECRLFLGKKKNAEFVTITDDYSSLERFDLKTRKKLESLECFFKLQIISSSSRRRREGNGFVARQRRFMGIFLTLRCIEETRSHLFRKRVTILSFIFAKRTTCPSTCVPEERSRTLVGRITKLCSFFSFDSEGRISCN